jgi:hypothetical protein
VEHPPRAGLVVEADAQSAALRQDPLPLLEHQVANDAGSDMRNAQRITGTATRPDILAAVRPDLS